MVTLHSTSLPTVFGKYTLVRRLAEGGMAEVFLARPNSGPDRPVVIKRILPHFTNREELVRMFVNEARIVARLRHANIQQIYDLGRVGQEYFLALEYVHGQDVANIVTACDSAGRAPLPFGTAVRLALDMCAGLDHAHNATDVTGRALGVVHRDVSPPNVVVTYDGRVKVIDFGVAKATEQALAETLAGVMKGKHAYMSPEQCRGERLDRRSDVFSVAVMLWELVAWQRLFRRPADYLTMRAVVEEPAPPVLARRPDAPIWLDEIFAKALAKDREHRYPTCQALAHDLEELARTERWDLSRDAMARMMRELFGDAPAE